ncbi:iron chelate uptake ABC transporter family permease subunit [Marinobacter xestospongiae]|uniref:Iron chelate uptake ABC transporter family permease subunit n=1 Tax=Marinobacter xestospongiae TaxID=994319 RepID=A0ABU3W178_9GAMM|nr:iron chelate uptake ABC transporter family permease subunit [Marinobacter xestospongiae]MDV2080261.1 iron chelate uptake ABC transporter family permease subunit [Marinobacter xestospongiae]
MRRPLMLSSWVAVLALAVVFVLLNSGLDTDYIIPKRLLRLAAMGLGGVCIAFSAIVFQSIAGNRILTPAIMGYESVYLLFQALLVWLLGTSSLMLMGQNGNFFASVLLMLAYSWVIHRWLFRDGRSNVYFLLLLGLVLTMVISTLTQFIQVTVSPGEFAVLQGYNEASFNRVRPGQLGYAAVLVLLVAGVMLRSRALLDVIALGREQALSLGVDYPRCVRQQLFLVAVLVAISTSLVGPTAFMGIFVANLAYALAGTTRHRATLPMASAVAVGLFILAQLLVEQVLNYRTTVTILINLICGGYFLALMIRTRGRA